MPHRQYFEAIASDSVVDPIADAIKVQPPHIRGTRFVDANSNVRLNNQKVERGPQILTYGARRCGSIYCPPEGHPFDLALGASRDEKFKRHSYP